MVAVASVIASPFFVLSYFGACETSASPLAKGNKKAQLHHTHIGLGNGRLRLQ
jgi:hypothetical protein